MSQIKIEVDIGFLRRDWDKIIESPLKRSGLLIRKIMRGSIRRKPFVGKTGRMLKPSKPGNPPYSRHTDGFMKRIYSVPMPDQGKAIIGAVRLSGTNYSVPQAHEFGLSVREKKWKWRGKGKNRKRKPRMETVRMPERPFAWPALQKAEQSEKLMQKWAGCVNSKTTKPKLKKV